MRGAVAATLGILALSAPGRAQTLEVSPVSITLAPDQRTASLTVTNRGAGAVTIQVRPFRWQEQDGSATLTETDALAASPPFAEVAAGQSQSVRILLRQPAGAAEMTYRLLIDQLPPATRSSAVRIALRLSLPVFAAPAGSGGADLRWSIATGAAGAFLDVVNRGTRHAAIYSVQFGSLHGPVAVRAAGHPYVLSGAHVRWPIERGRAWPAAPVALTITSDTGTLMAAAPIVSAPP